MHAASPSTAPFFHARAIKLYRGKGKCGSDSNLESIVAEAEGDLDPTESGPTKKTKLTGAFQYKTPFSAECRKTFPFVPGPRQSEL